MSRIPVWKAKQFQRTIPFFSVLMILGLLIAVFEASPSAAADTPKKGGFYNLSGPALGQDYVTGGTALMGDGGDSNCGGQ